MPRADADDDRVELRLRPEDKATLSLADAPLSLLLPLAIVADALVRLA